MRREQGSVISFTPGADLRPSRLSPQPSSAALRFEHTFGFGPVALSTINVGSAAQASREMESVLRAGYQGAFLAAGRLGPSEFASCIRQVASSHRGAWIGLKLATVPSLEDLDLLIDQARNLWISGMDGDGGYEWIGQEIERIRCTEHWDGLLFGSLTPADEDDPAAGAVCLSRFVDVVVKTIAPGTTDAQRQAQTIKHALGNFPLALALGQPRVKLDGLAKAADCLITLSRLHCPAVKAS